MSDQAQLQELLAALDPQQRELLRQAVAETPAEPQAPATLLDELRAEEADVFERSGVSPISDVPNPHELPIVVALLLREHRDLSDRLAVLEAEQAGEPVPASDTPSGVPVVNPPAPDPAQAPAGPADPGPVNPLGAGPVPEAPARVPVEIQPAPPADPATPDTAAPAAPADKNVNPGA